MKNNKITVYGDIEVDVFNITENDIHIETIAHSLAMQCRYGGHCSRFYSVASHSILTSYLLQDKYDCGDVDRLLAALLHDAAEAYLIDLPKPLKDNPKFEWYRKLEDQVLRVIFNKFGLSRYLNDTAIKNCDEIALATEGRNLFKLSHEWGLPVRPSLHDINELYPVAAEKEFMKRFEFLSTVHLDATCKQDVLANIRYAMKWPFKNVVISGKSFTYDIKRLAHVTKDLDRPLSKRKELLERMFERVDACDPKMFKG